MRNLLLLLIVMMVQFSATAQKYAHKFIFDSTVYELKFEKNKMTGYKMIVCKANASLHANNCCDSIIGMGYKSPAIFRPVFKTLLSKFDSTAKTDNRLNDDIDILFESANDFIAVEEKAAGQRIAEDEKNEADKKIIDSLTALNEKYIAESKKDKKVIDTPSFKDNFSYDATNLFNLTLKKYSGKTEMKICKDTIAGIDTCITKIVFGDIKRETFVRFTKEMVSKLMGNISLDSLKFDPLPEDEYVNYIAEMAKKQPKEPTESEKQMTIINNKLEDLFNEKATKKSIGYFKLVDSLVNIKNCTKRPGIDSTEVKIASVEIVMANGAIRKNGIKVTLVDGRIFRNKWAPVTLYRLDRRKGDVLRVDDIDYNDIIEIRQVFNYVYNGKFSYPGDETAILTPRNPIDTLYTGSTISELLDVNVYSDLLALVGRKANGIIQTQVTGIFLTNSNNIWRNKDFMIHNFVKAYFRLSKYDSKFGQLDSINNSRDKVDSVINRLYLNQIAYLQAGLKTNIFRLGIGNNQQLYLNAGAEISLTNADSIYKKDLVTVNYFPEIEYTINRLDNFGLEASIKYLWQKSPKNSPYKNRETICIFNPQATIYYYPFSNPNNKIYIRYAHFAQIGDAKYNYPQFQFGFKTNLFAKKDKSE